MAERKSDRRCTWGAQTLKGSCGEPAVAWSRPRADDVPDDVRAPICADHARTAQFADIEYFPTDSTEPSDA